MANLELLTRAIIISLALLPTTHAHAADPSAIGDEVWSALEGKFVIIETSSGVLEGELAAIRGDTLVIISADGTVASLPKHEASHVRVAKVEPKDPSNPTVVHADSPPDNVSDQEDIPSRKERRRQRNEARTHALLGTFSAHGVSYAHWRGDGVSAGHAAYAMDWGVGLNATDRFGMYAVAGGLLGARINDKEIRANYAHIAFMFAFGGKYYHSMIGAGAAFNRMRFPDELQKDVGLSIPAKIFGKIPLPHKLYLGIGISYELGIVRNFNRYVNGIGGQIVVGRW